MKPNKIPINLSIDPTLKSLAIEHKINFSNALSLGVKITLADLHVMDYPAECALTQKLETYKRKLENHAHNAHSFSEESSS